MSGSGTVGVGVVGAGTISNEYLRNLLSFPDVTVHIVADIFEDKAAEQAAAFGVPQSGSPDAAFSHPDVELIINLTIPAAHTEVSLAALDAGKHVWTEKPFSLDRASGRQILDKAAAAGLTVGGAPDTFLGSGLQTARRLIERGDIGVPLTGLTLFESPGPADDHRNLEVLHSKGAGPVWDIGPYYLTTLVETFGSFSSVIAKGRTARPKRVIQVGPKTGEEFTVQIPTHVSVIGEFETGEMATTILSWDIPKPRGGLIEITGTEAVMAVPDPNVFEGAVLIRRNGETEWTSVPSTGAIGGRGLGALELARAIRAGQPARASGELAYHVMDAMASISESAEREEAVKVESSVTKSAALPEEWDPYASTL